MTPTCPDIRPNAVYGIGDAAKLLGMSRDRLRHYCNLETRQGGIAFVIPKGETRKKFRGADIIDFWCRKSGMQQPDPTPWRKFQRLSGKEK